MTQRVWKTLEPRNLELGPLAQPGDEIGTWRHWKLKRDEDDILWLVFDKSGSSANTLSQEVLTELDDVLGKIEEESAKGLVLRSAKPAGFIAGADVNELRDANNAADIEGGLHDDGRDRIRQQMPDHDARIAAADRSGRFSKLFFAQAQE